MNKAKIKFYGTTWCPDCIRSKQFLDENGVEYEFIDLATNPSAAEEVEKINHGMQSIPTIVFPNGKILVEPANEELKKAIEENQDFIIIHNSDKRMSS